MLDNLQHQQILNLLKGVNSQKPMRFHVLQGLAHCSADALHAVLDEMYAADRINQAVVERGDIKQREVWPTGMVNFTNTYRAGAKIKPTPLPRRDEVKPKLMEEAQMKTAAATLEANTINDKPRALQVLEYIEANPGCNNAEINQHFSFASPVSYIKKHIEKQRIRRTYIGKRDAVYHIEEGFTAASIYGNGYKNNHGHGSQASKAPAVQACRPEDKAMLATDAGKELVSKAVTAMGEYETPAFLSKPPSQDDLAIDSIETLFDLLPPESSIIIGREDGELQVEINSTIFGRPLYKKLKLNQVVETLNALRIVAVEMG